ncbi:MAG: SpoIID/LytB domain-containing protein [Puniceicoccales bacterium]|nr:SpoIID/LytB domain-containing protein [Puniceicoccales bacterium]
MIGKIKYILLVALLACGLSSCCRSGVPAVEGPSIRVAISDNRCKEFLYGEISITATGEYTIYLGNPKVPLITVRREQPTKIKLVDGAFEISTSSKTMANVKGPVFVECPKGLLGIVGLQRGNRRALYRGRFEAKMFNGKFFLVNTLSLEDYLKGVVPNEMPVKFGHEALKAQAVAARNYALAPRHREFKEFDLFDSVDSQVYFGANSEFPESNAAVKETMGLVMVYDWQPILAMFSSTAGGHTENYENAFSDPQTNVFPGTPRPYLKGVPDDPSVKGLDDEFAASKFYRLSPKSYDVESRHYRWAREWTVDELERILPQTVEEQMATGFVKSVPSNATSFGKIEGIDVKKRGVSGKIMELEIVTNAQRITLKKELVIRRVFKKNNEPLPSANVVFDAVTGKNGGLVKIVARGGGFGHGVGMSQFGAGFMGTRLHKTFDKILKKYYTGVSITTVPITLSSAGTPCAVTQSFWAARKSASIVINAKSVISRLTAKINGKVVRFPIGSIKSNSDEPLMIDISRHIRRGLNTIEFRLPRGEKEDVALYVEVF